MMVLDIAFPHGEYRPGDLVWLRRIEPARRLPAINRDVPGAPKGGRFAFGRLIDRQRVAGWAVAVADGDRSSKWSTIRRGSRWRKCWSASCEVSWQNPPGALVTSVDPVPQRGAAALWHLRGQVARRAPARALGRGGHQPDRPAAAGAGPLSRPARALQRDAQRIRPDRASPAYSGCSRKWARGSTRRPDHQAVLPLARDPHAQRPFDLVDAQFFFPDGPAAMAVAAIWACHLSVKARGATSIIGASAPHGRDALLIFPPTPPQACSRCSEALADDMAELGMARDGSRCITPGSTAICFARWPSQCARKRLGESFGIDLAQGSDTVLVTVGALIERKGQAYRNQGAGRSAECTFAAGGRQGRGRNQPARTGRAGGPGRPRAFPRAASNTTVPPS